MSTTFKKGDRVILVKDRGSARKGMKGTVVTDISGGDYGVKFDEEFPLGHDLDGKCEFGFGHWIAPDEMELIPKFSVGQVYKVGKLTYPHQWENAIVKVTDYGSSFVKIKALRGDCPKDFMKDSEYARALTLLTGSEIGEAIKVYDAENAPKPAAVKKVKRAAKVGEYVKTIGSNGGFIYPNTIYLVKRICPDGDLIVNDPSGRYHCTNTISSDNYVVLENYKLEQKGKHSYTSEQIDKAKQIVLDTIHELYSESKGSVVLSTGVFEPKTIHAYVFENGKSSITSGAGGTVPFMADKVAHGSAKCSDNDEPNEWIGKCVALCKALHKPIPKFITEG